MKDFVKEIEVILALLEMQFDPPNFLETKVMLRLEEELKNSLLSAYAEGLTEGDKRSFRLGEIVGRKAGMEEAAKIAYKAFDQLDRTDQVFIGSVTEVIMGNIRRTAAQDEEKK